MEESIIVVAVIVSVIAVAFSSFSLFLTYRKIKNNKNVTNNLITIQRENVENKVFQSSEPLITDPGFFTDANHLLLSASKDMVIHRKLPDFSFFEEMAIDLSQVEIKQNTIACLMPFNRKFDKIKFALEDVCKTQGYTFRRSDDELIADNTDLRKSIIRMILEAEVILAVLDGRNPNVYYEIGIAHSMGKLVLMVANLNREDSKNLPADILSNRLITYNDVHDLKVKLTKTLKAIQYDD